MSTNYRLLLIGHIVSVVVGFGSLLGLPLMGRVLRSDDNFNDAMRRSWHQSAIRYRRVVAEPAFVLIGVFAVSLVIGHPDPELWKARWIQLAGLFYLIAAVAILGVQGQIIRRLPKLIDLMETNDPLPGVPREQGAHAKRLVREAKIADLISGVSAIGLIVMVSLMIWRPT
jgi:uncharacterized membrane protein